MQKIPYDATRNWSTAVVHGRVTITRPTSIKIRCPHCGTIGAFSGNDATLKPEIDFIFWRTPCPNCNGHVRFFIECVPVESDRRADIYMHPAHSEWTRQTDLSRVPPRLSTIFTEALEAQGAKLWRSACSSCRTTLEGVLKEIWPSGVVQPGTLSRKIKTLGASGILPGPLADLANNVRTGGNIAAHLDDEREPNEAVARAMLRLTDYFLEYVFALPQMVKDLDVELSQLDLCGSDNFDT